MFTISLGFVIDAFNVVISKRQNEHTDTVMHMIFRCICTISGLKHLQTPNSEKALNS